MCCLYMEDSVAQDSAAGALLVPPHGVLVLPENTNNTTTTTNNNNNNTYMDASFLSSAATTTTTVPLMIDHNHLLPNAAAGGADDFHYLIHGDLPRGMFEQLDMLNFPPLESAVEHHHHHHHQIPLPASHHHHLESLDDIVHAGSSFTPVATTAATRSSSSAASSSSGTTHSSGGGEFFQSQDTGATSILHPPPPPPPPPLPPCGENGNIPWTSSQVDTTPWVCDPSVAAFYATEVAAGSTGCSSLYLDSVVTNSASTSEKATGSTTTTTTTTNPGMHATMRETLYRMAIWRPVNTSDLVMAGGGKPKRRNVKISSDPQTVAARHRRERISTKIRILQRLVPGGTKMDTASMLDEAIHYVKYLKSQVQAMELLEQSSESLLLRGCGTTSTKSPATSCSTITTSANTTTGSTATIAPTTTASLGGGAGMCHQYNPGHTSFFWPQQFPMDSASGLNVVQQVNISGY